MFRIDIKTDNAAFEYDRNAEIARILRKLADTLDTSDSVRDWHEYNLRDSNGNTVGSASLAEG